MSCVDSAGVNQKLKGWTLGWVEASDILHFAIAAQLFPFSCAIHQSLCISPCQVPTSAKDEATGAGHSEREP